MSQKYRERKKRKDIVFGQPQDNGNGLEYGPHDQWQCIFFTVSPPFSGPAVPDLAPSLTCRFIPASADCALYVFRVAARGFFSLIQTLAQLHR